MLTLPNYQISTQIYESANSLVYRGIRKKDNKPIILKILKQDYPTPEELTRYRQEYEITRNLDLDDVVKTYGIEKYQNTLVIILEDFGGESLKNLLNPFAKGGSEVEVFAKGRNEAEVPPFFKEGLGGILFSDFLPLAIQIAEALSQIHAANIIHKDINPANIVWNQETNQLKIIDFGIATRLPRENPTLKNPEQLEGTLAYLSPEQTGRMNRSLDYRTDLYSLGVTFYELLTGKVPFDSDSAMELVHCHIAKTPKSVSEINPEVPPIISDIVMKLMAKNVEDRYQSAFGVKADLEKCQENLQGLNDENRKAFKNLEGFDDENLPGFKNLAGLDFELAQNDFSGKLQIPQKLYGREHEINTLLQAFERVSGGATEMMLVAGYSGVGKTALVHEVHKPMTEKHGYFAAGKFDQFQKNVPYSAITQAFKQFCRYLLMENAETLANWQTEIWNAVGNNGQIIIDVIPDLELVIGPQPAVAQVGPTEAQNRFQMFFLKFVKALCTKEHPFILFIDDLQWVDSASLGLLKSIVLDDEIRYLLIIGAYRDNEVDSSHPFIMVVDELQKTNITINTIELSNLQPQAVNYLLQDTFKCEASLTQPLTDLIYQKTQGNAFFTHQFLQTLYQDALLRFDFIKLKWQWEVEKIATQNISDNVVDLMTKKIDKLPSKTSKVLQLAACIGNQFELSILAIIYEQKPNDTLLVLRPAMTEGLIQPLDENYKHIDTASQAQFKFLHDRVQQAAYAMVNDKQKRTVHLKIGRLLLTNTPTDALEDKIFDIVGQFNQSLELLNNQAEKLKIAKLNLMAGQKSKMATAYGAAVNYFTKGRECLAEKSWEEEYDLTLNLHTEAAEAAYLSGDFEQMEQLAQIVLQQAQTLSDEVKICEIQISAYVAQHQLRKTVKIALLFLKRVGIVFPEEPTQKEVELAFQKMQVSVSGKTIQSFLNLPMMTTTNNILAMRIMIAVIPATYFVSPKLMILLVLKQIDLLLEYGNISESSASYVDYGAILCGIIGDIESGYQFGQMALDLLKQSGERGVNNVKVTHAFYALIKLWKSPVRETLQPLLGNFQMGLETGNIEIAGYSIYTYAYYSYFSGKQLTLLEPEMSKYSHALSRLKQEIALNWHHIFWQTILNLMGQSNHPCHLIGEIYDENLQLPLYQQANNRTAIHLLHLNKCILHYLFQEYQHSARHALIAEQYLDGVNSMLVVAIFHFYDSLARLALYPSLPKPEQEAVLAKVSANQDKMQKWAAHAPMNFQHKYNLVEAEKARVLGQLNAIEWYEKAITGASDNEYLNEEALAYQLIAEFYLERTMDKVAQTYLKEAHYRYQQWGAIAKVTDLEKRYPQWLIRESPPTMSTTFTSTSKATILASTRTQASTSQWLDLESVMKAAQTLSGEIVLSRLLSKMMHIVIENAGAQRGFLILPQEDKWVIEAEGVLDKQKVTVLHSLPIENNLPEAIINYVARTQENVVLTDARQKGLYTENPYIKAHQTQSALCFPIVYQQQLRAILYFENNLTTGAFTKQRLNVLKILSSQIAISLENAQYATQLEDKVKQRTAELAEANQHIMALNNQLKAENLRMSAELNVAKQLQQMVLPKESELQQVENLDIAGFMEPADEIGGDYYEVLNHNGHIKIGIGDVTGHGLESGVLMLMVQTTVRALLLAGIEDPERFLNVINGTIYHNAKRMETDKNLTLSLLDYQEGQLRITGQHEEILLVRKNSHVELIDTFELGYSVGVVADIANWVAQRKISLQPGDGIVLYTDGITEARDSKMEVYGIERLCEVISYHWHLSASEIQRAVIDDVKQYIGTQKVYDDITLLVLKQK